MASSTAAILMKSSPFRPPSITARKSQYMNQTCLQHTFAGRRLITIHHQSFARNARSTILQGPRHASSCHPAAPSHPVSIVRSSLSSWNMLRPHAVQTRNFLALSRIYQPIRLMSSDAPRSQQGSAAKGKDTPDSTTSTNTIQAPTILSKLNPLGKPKERKENIYTIPNMLTASRLFAAPGICYAILTSHPHLALGLFAYAGFTDLIDGFLARRYNSQTVLGTILDPMADKTLMTTVVVCLTIKGLLPIWLSVIILGRDVALAISAIYFRWISLPPPKTFTRYWDFSLPSAEVHPTEISKINTLLQLLLVGNAMLLPALPDVLVQTWNLYGVFEGWQYLVASTTVWSGLSYVFNKDAVKILSEEEALAREKEAKRPTGEVKP